MIWPKVYQNDFLKIKSTKIDFQKRSTVFQCCYYFTNTCLDYNFKLQKHVMLVIVSFISASFYIQILNVIIFSLIHIIRQQWGQHILDNNYYNIAA